MTQSADCVNPDFDTLFLSSLREQLLAWYDREQRALPWRKDRDPYRVWVSEIMLQQTRVAAVLGYYEPFLKHFPNVRALARAKEDAVLAAWSGLGYYRRARGLHAAAKIIVSERKGRFPTSAAEWEKLPGVGRYTAAAIASIAFDEPRAVVDGNVERVVTRLLGGGTSQRSSAESQDRDRVEQSRLSHSHIWATAQQLLSPERPGDFNQAMMELGATVCLPKEPLCHQCPVTGACRTRGSVPGTTPAARIKAEMRFALSVTKGRVYLTRRAAEAQIMPGMWELPAPREGNAQEALFKVRHSITTSDYEVTVVRQNGEPEQQGEWVRFSKALKLPLTGVTRKILRKAGIIESE